MKKVLSGVIAATFAATVGLAAQAPGAPAAPGAPPSTQAPEPSPTGTSGREQAGSPASQSQAGAVTIAGCVQNAPPAATASASAGKPDSPSAGASASASTQPRFILANAKQSASAAAPSSAVGTSGTSTRYELDGQSAELAKHVNHQVEITGTVQPASAGGAAGAAAAAPKLMVTAVKMVAATCP